MIRGIYCIRDEASQLFLQPSCDMNDQTAIRNFDYAMQKNDMMSFRPEDFSLWRVGDFDDVKGMIGEMKASCIKRGEKKNARK